jgi:hypothetical protein
VPVASHKALLADWAWRMKKSCMVEYLLGECWKLFYLRRGILRK